MEREILNLIEKSSNVLIITHVNPDGDTLGCASALKSYIGKKADILLQINDNSNFPTTYYFLPHIKEALNFSSLQDKYDQDKYNLIIAVDCASKDRIIAHAREIFDNCPNTIVIDHHKTNKGYGKINYIKGGISSTAEVLFEILKDNLTKEIATGLYVGILTDTGCFKYESTTDKTLNIAKKL
ncbi:DHH family phosphoesterase, partial [bacterium]|nr:DHH family phosphoesterase [bacterium]